MIVTTDFLIARSENSKELYESLKAQYGDQLSLYVARLHVVDGSKVRKHWCSHTVLHSCEE